MSASIPPSAAADATSATPASLTDAEKNIHVSLTHEPLQLTSTVDRVRSPKAGAIVLFAGTTRDNFQDQPVKTLSYSAYVPLALRTILSICQSVKEKHGLLGIAVTHRLGDVGIGEESVHVAVSAPHRKAAWEAGEETLELVKERVEVWKMECFEDGAVWRSNKDGQRGVRMDIDETKADEGK
ncbi:Molybdopterin biosynthesis MoaE [Sphaerosporella brunnea]|uniref:Molybdopterin synthase catalytic subunit n=1 Tax=Sphaerosporella brunnea TaxID=1250544 RepID=A0A5J5F2I0_9PEZI|nr:Molybdopterin biosynthesis MoaE [Sphaerosporella brunnea]